MGQPPILAAHEEDSREGERMNAQIDLQGHYAHEAYIGRGEFDGQVVEYYIYCLECEDTLGTQEVEPHEPA
jgi:hypothetical protein